MSSTFQNTQGVSCITIPTPFAVGDVNVYLIKGESLTLVDVGPKTEEAWLSLTTQLQQIGVMPEEIEQVVITHHHPDHVGLLDYFDLGKVNVVGYKYNKPWLRQDKQFLQYHHQFYKKLYESMGASEFYKLEMKKIEKYISYSCKIQMNRFLNEGDDIGGLPGWKVIETPGHAQGHISLFNEETGSFIAGDHLIKHISSNAIIEPPGFGDFERPKSLLIYRESLKKCLGFPIQQVFPGHGDVFVGAHELIHDRLQKHEERAGKIRAIIEGSSLTAFEICQKLFPLIYKKEFGLTMSETIGHIDLLVEQGKAKVIEDRETLRFKSE
jgi:glyoxylase-like metal-dependent hydrolase (beta-lactamase superfamily II)